jgi:hypothetical protein
MSIRKRKGDTEIEKARTIRDYQTALSFVRKYLQKSPQEPHYLEHLINAEIMISKGDWKKSTEFLKKVLEVNPDNQVNSHSCLLFKFL